MVDLEHSNIRCLICGKQCEDYAVHLLEPVAARVSEDLRPLIGDEGFFFVALTCRDCEGVWQERVGDPIPLAARDELRGIFTTAIDIDKLPSTEP